MRRFVGSMVGVSLAGLLLWGCECSDSISPPENVPEGSKYAAFKVHRSSLAITDALFTKQSGFEPKEPLLTVGRGGRGFLYPNDKYGTPLLLDTEADLLAAFYTNGENIKVCGMREDGAAVLRAYHGDGWETITHSAAGNFTGVHEDHICTDEGWILRYSGGAHTVTSVFQAPEGVRFNAIFELIGGQRDIIAVGDDGVIFHNYDGGEFVDESIDGGPDFVAVAFSFDQETDLSIAYAVGDDEIWQFLGGIWSLVYDFADSPLNDIALLPDGMALVVGDNGLLLQKDEHGWWDDFIDGGVDLTAVARNPYGGEIIACGSAGQVYQLDVHGWRDLNHHAEGLWAAFHVANSGTAYVANGNKLMRYIGNDLVEFAVWEMGHEIPSFHVVDTTHVWAIGVMDDGIDHFVLFYDGSDWSVMKHASLDGFNAIWCDAAGENVCVTADAGQIWWRHGEIWELEVDRGASVAFHGLYGTDMDNLLAVGDSGLIMRRGPGGWAEEPSGTSFALRSVSGPVIVGESGTILVHTGDRWEIADIELDTHFNAVWYGAAGDIWVVGNDAAVLHYDGSSWTRLLTHLPGIDFLAVAGFGLNNVWIGGSEGYLLQGP